MAQSVKTAKVCWRDGMGRWWRVGIRGWISAEMPLMIMETLQSSNREDYSQH
jgi:hypothetical protein